MLQCSTLEFAAKAQTNLQLYGYGATCCKSSLSLVVPAGLHRLPTVAPRWSLRTLWEKRARSDVCWSSALDASAAEWCVWAARSRSTVGKGDPGAERSCKSRLEMKSDCRRAAHFRKAIAAARWEASQRTCPRTGIAFVVARRERSLDMCKVGSSELVCTCLFACPPRLRKRDPAPLLTHG